MFPIATPDVPICDPRLETRLTASLCKVPHSLWRQFFYGASFLMTPVFPMRDDFLNCATLIQNADRLLN